MNSVAAAKTKKIRYLLGVGFGVVLVCSTLALVLVLQTRAGTGEGEEQKARVKYFEEGGEEGGITFDEFVGRSFSAKYFNGSWWSNTELQWKDTSGSLVTWDLTTYETTVLVSQDLLSSFSGTGTRFMGFSPDESLLLFALEPHGVWRHSFTAQYVVFDSAQNTSHTVVAKDGSERLQYCDWVANGKDENILVYVSGNNLFWRAAGGSPGSEQDIPITEDGVTDNVFNGIPDWVYEEEVLGENFAHYINKEGTRIAFAQFNDTLVPEFNYPYYGSPEDVIHSQYPQYRTVKYPKAGETNPTVDLFVRTFEGVVEGTNQPVVPPPEVLAWSEYIYTVVTWPADDLLSVTWMNRIQNESIISECSQEGGSWACVTTFTQAQEDGWIEIAPPPLHSESGDSFIQILPSMQASDNRNYKHIASISSTAGVTFLTSGNFVVTQILSWDQGAGLVYFMGTDTEAPGARHFYVVPDDGSQDIECITCSLETSRGDLCARNSIALNQDKTYYVHSCLGQGLPEAVLRKMEDHSVVFVFQDNQDLEDRLSEKVLSTRVDKVVELEGGFSAPVKISLPPNLDESKQYPVLVYVYGGPGSQMVSDSWTLGWGEFLATSRNVIYVSIDGRGTGFQSDEHLFQVYRNLGTVEMRDQISVTRELVQAHPYMDPARTAIWGWSYGGFATAMTLEQDVGDSPVFSCGISVAPVTSWLLYDSVYTERYMALPSHNLEGYNNSVISGMENLRNKTWMLNHGVADDNVHFQHSMLLTKALEEADIQFVQHSYPDENHSLGGVSRFLYHAMDNFWKDCFDI